MPIGRRCLHIGTVGAAWDIRVSPALQEDDGEIALHVALQVVVLLLLGEMQRLRLRGASARAVAGPFDAEGGGVGRTGDFLVDLGIAKGLDG